jgi:KUP system potassium uptake protein
MKLKPFIANIAESGVERVPGTAVFMTPDPECAARLLHSLKHYKACTNRSSS